ncbi:MAG TPA: hypothetical protein PLQ67_05820, partial [Burkholderiaceae bacterium]|nr:hypothetical protein [Burkholderiaceae bacterium]
AVGRTQGEAFNKRLNSETELNIEFYKNALAQATQKRIQAGSDLEAAKAAGQPVMAAGAQAQSAWATVRAKADNARDQSLGELAIGGQIFALESNTTGALASAYGLMITNSATQSALVGALAEAGEIGLDELSALEDTVQGNVQYALSGLNTLQQDVANFRAMADQEQDQLVPLQATAYGTQLIANDKLNDAAYLGGVYEAVAVPDAQLKDLQADVDAAARRLSQAKLALDVADLRMDWAEKRVNPLKQMRDMDRAAPGLEAAQVELDAAQQDYDAKLALLNSVKYDVGRLHLKPMALESGWEAESGVIEANIAGTQALAQGGWSRMAEGRYFNLDNVLASVQGLLIQDTSTLSGVQQTMADQLEAIDPVAAELMGVQAQWNAGWANDFAAISDSIRAGQYQTFNDQAQLRELTATADGNKLYGDYLGQRVEALGADYGQAKTTLSDMATALTASNALASSTYETADAARTQMNDTELEAMVGYVLSNPKKLDPSFTVESLYPKARAQVIETKLKDEAFASVLPVVRAEMEGGAAQPTDEEFERRVNLVYEELVAQGREVTVTDEEVRRTAMQLFVQEAQDKGITNRQLHKQLRYLDDRQQWVDADPAVQGARAHALGSAQSADAASAQAIDDGLKWQSQAFFTQVQGQRLLGASTEWADAMGRAADGADQVLAQSDKVIESLKIDQTNQSGMLEYLANYLDGNAQLAQYMGDYGQMAQHPGVRALMTNQHTELKNVNVAYAPLAENAEQLIEHAGESLVLAVDQAELWETRATDWRAQATVASTQLGSIQPMIEADGVQLQSDDESFGNELNKAYGFNDSAVAYVREHADKAKDAKELHEDRLTADHVHKQRKKKNLFKLIAMAVVGTIVTIATLGAAAPEVAAFMAGAAPSMFAAGGAATVATVAGAEAALAG